MTEVTPDRMQQIPGWRWRLPALGLAQIIAWGSLYYAIALISRDLARVTDVTQATVFGAFTLALVVSGLTAPLTGRLVDAGHGRRVLAVSAGLAATGFALLAAARGPILLFAAWSVLGAAMGCGLYDAAFAVLHRLVPLRQYRRAVTQLTLFGGFASTVFWPLTEVLLARWGLSGVLWTFASLQLAVSMPLYLSALPRRTALPAPDLARGHPTAFPVARSPRFLALAAAFALASFAVSVVSVHLIALLTAGGLAAGDAVLIGALFGPMQVLARVVEYRYASRFAAVSVGSVSFLLLSLSLVVLTQTGTSLLLPVGFALLYGAGNGIMTIVRGTVPAQLFVGEPAFGALLGQLALPSFVAKAIAPFLFALLLAATSRASALAMLLAVSLLAWGAFEVARRHAVGVARDARDA